MSVSRPPCPMTTTTAGGFPTCCTSPHGDSMATVASHLCNISNMLDQRTNKNLREAWQLLHIALEL